MLDDYGGIENGDQAGTYDEVNSALYGSTKNDEINLTVDHQYYRFVKVVWGGLGDDVITVSPDHSVFLIELYGNAGHDVIYGRKGRNNTIFGGDGDDFISGGDFGNKVYGGYDDDLIYGGDSHDSIYGDNYGRGRGTSLGEDGDDIIYGGDGSDSLYGEGGNDKLYGGYGNDTIFGMDGSDSLNGGSGDDWFYPGHGANTIDGGDGNDFVTFEYVVTEIIAAIQYETGAIEIQTANSTDTIINVENAYFFTDDAIPRLVKIPLASLVTTTIKPTPPSFNKMNQNGDFIVVTPETYEGPVDFLDYQLLGEETSDVITGSTFNDFMNLLGGDDAANGGDGEDVLDGGTGSNFLTGGNGADTFFLDGRGGDATWSTITDFSGDNVNIWGWSDGVSKLLLTQALAGADRFQGATFHYDLNNDGQIDTSITFTGLTNDQVPTGSAQVVADNGYLLFA